MRTRRRPLAAELRSNDKEWTMHRYRKVAGGSDLGRVAMISLILAGIGMILFAATCFEDIPLIGTVFRLPGDSIFQAKMTDPLYRYAIFLIGGICAAFGIQLQILTGFTNALKQGNQDPISDQPSHSRRKPWGHA